jgi:bifunctional non-homologous end joining protein LigD
MSAALELPRSGSAELTIEGRDLTLTSLDKVMYPATGFTKADMIGYYVAVAGALLPHLAGRPVTLGRFPDGVEGPGFAQTECRGRPDWLATRPLQLRGGETRNFCLIEEVAALVWAANLGTLELHPYLGVGEQESAVLVVFDLDPGHGADMVATARAALALRTTLGEIGLASFPKTSGAFGLHVYVPLNVPHEYRAVRDFAAEIAAGLDMGEVTIDWRQNHPRRSMIAPYSLRAVRRPSVSAPIDWTEVERAVATEDSDLLRFGPDEVIARLGAGGDLFQPVLERRQRLPS